MAWRIPIQTFAEFLETKSALRALALLYVELLSLVLGVRRPGITVALQSLEGMHIIRNTRGRIRVLNRARLKEAAGDSYGVPEAEYRRLLGRHL